MSPQYFDRMYSFSVRFFEISESERNEVYREVRDSYQLRPSYLMMLVLACLVAILGLLANSPAVVIGAMLISPLMSPFLSAGLALAIGDWELGKAAMRTILLSVIAAILISALAVAISPLKEPTSEILARTNPNLLDLGIAFFSGCAGTYTLVSRKGLTAIPGVAIATAVMPPLCVVGFGVFQLDAHIVFGALSLFVTNLAAIIVSAAILFFLASFRISEINDEKPHWSVSTRLIVSVVILGLLAIPLALALITAAENSRLRRNVGLALTQQLKPEESRTRLVGGWSVQRIENRGLVVEATIRTLNYFSRSEVEALTRALEQKLGEPVDLQLDQIQVRKGGLAPEVTPKPVEPKLLPVTDPVYFSRLSQDFLPAVQLGLTTLNARLDQYFLVTDQKGVTRIEIIAGVETFPLPEVVDASRRAVIAKLESDALVRQPPPGIWFYFVPKNPFELTVRIQKGQLIVDLDQLTLLRKTLTGFLDQTPRPRIRVRFADRVQLTTELKTGVENQILKQLGLPPTLEGSFNPEWPEPKTVAPIEILVSEIDDTLS
ncbi:MAG: TIGR00341 family protein [Acidobacteria bacterium]|nr:TIGR00341 family protein [Acidobacteriota bacterium]